MIEVVDYDSDSDDSLPRPLKSTKKSKKQKALPDEISFRVEGSLPTVLASVQPANTQQPRSEAGDSQTLPPPDASAIHSADIGDFDDTPPNQESSDSTNNKKVSRRFVNLCALMLMRSIV